MEYILKLFILSGKYLTRITAQSILQAYNSSIIYANELHKQYEKALSMSGEFENMLEMYNSNLEEIGNNAPSNLVFLSDRHREIFEKCLNIDDSKNMSITNNNLSEFPPKMNPHLQSKENKDIEVPKTKVTFDIIKEEILNSLKVSDNRKSKVIQLYNAEYLKKSRRIKSIVSNKAPSDDTNIEKHFRIVADLEDFYPKILLTNPNKTHALPKAVKQFLPNINISNAIDYAKAFEAIQDEINKAKKILEENKLHFIEFEEKQLAKHVNKKMEELKEDILSLKQCLDVNSNWFLNMENISMNNYINSKILSMKNEINVEERFISIIWQVFNNLENKIFNAMIDFIKMETEQISKILSINQDRFNEMEIKLKRNSIIPEETEVLKVPIATNSKPLNIEEMHNYTADLISINEKRFNEIEMKLKRNSSIPEKTEDLKVPIATNLKSLIIEETQNYTEDLISINQKRFNEIEMRLKRNSIIPEEIEDLKVPIVTDLKPFNVEETHKYTSINQKRFNEIEMKLKRNSIISEETEDLKVPLATNLKPFNFEETHKYTADLISINQKRFNEIEMKLKRNSIIPEETEDLKVPIATNLKPFNFEETHKYTADLISINQKRFNEIEMKLKRNSIIPEETEDLKVPFATNLNPFNFEETHKYTADLISINQKRFNEIEMKLKRNSIIPEETEDLKVPIATNLNPFNFEETHKYPADLISINQKRFNEIEMKLKRNSIIPEETNLKRSNLKSLNIENSSTDLKGYKEKNVERIVEENLRSNEISDTEIELNSLEGEHSTDMNQSSDTNNKKSVTLSNNTLNDTFLETLENNIMETSKEILLYEEEFKKLMRRLTHKVLDNFVDEVASDGDIYPIHLFNKREIDHRADVMEVNERVFKELESNLKVVKIIKSNSNVGIKTPIESGTFTSSSVKTGFTKSGQRSMCSNLFHYKKQGHDDNVSQNDYHSLQENKIEKKCLKDDNVNDLSERRNVLATINRFKSSNIIKTIDDETKLSNKLAMTNSVLQLINDCRYKESSKKPLILLGILSYLYPKNKINKLSVISKETSIEPAKTKNVSTCNDLNKKESYSRNKEVIDKKSKSDLIVKETSNLKEPLIIEPSKINNISRCNDLNKKESYTENKEAINKKSKSDLVIKEISSLIESKNCLKTDKNTTRPLKIQSFKTKKLGSNQINNFRNTLINEMINIDSERFTIYQKAFDDLELKILTKERNELRKMLMALEDIKSSENVDESHKNVTEIQKKSSSTVPLIIDEVTQPRQSKLINFTKNKKNIATQTIRKECLNIVDGPKNKNKMNFDKNTFRKKSGTSIKNRVFSKNTQEYSRSRVKYTTITKQTNNINNSKSSCSDEKKESEKPESPIVTSDKNMKTIKNIENKVKSPSVKYNNTKTHENWKLYKEARNKSIETLKSKKIEIIDEVISKQNEHLMFSKDYPSFIVFDENYHIDVPTQENTEKVHEYIKVGKLTDFNDLSIKSYTVIESGDVEISKDIKKLPDIKITKDIEKLPDVEISKDIETMADIEITKDIEKLPDVENSKKYQVKDVQESSVIRNKCPSNVEIRKPLRVIKSSMWNMEQREKTSNLSFVLNKPGRNNRTDMQISYKNKRFRNERKKPDTVLVKPGVVTYLLRNKSN